MAKDIIKFFLGLLALPLWFYDTAMGHYGCEILTGRGACHSGGLEIFVLIKTLSSGSAVRLSGLPIRLLPPHTIRRYGGQPVANTFPSCG